MSDYSDLGIKNQQAYAESHEGLECLKCVGENSIKALLAEVEAANAKALGHYAYAPETADEDLKPNAQFSIPSTQYQIPDTRYPIPNTTKLEEELCVGALQEQRPIGVECSEEFTEPEEPKAAEALELSTEERCALENTGRRSAVTGARRKRPKTPGSKRSTVEFNVAADVYAWEERHNRPLANSARLVAFDAYIAAFPHRPNDAELRMISYLSHFTTMKHAMDQRKQIALEKTAAIPDGSLPRIASMDGRDPQPVRRLLALIRLLALEHEGKPFQLARSTVQQVTGYDPYTADSVIKLFIGEGLLKLAEPGAGSRATCYVYTGALFEVNGETWDPATGGFDF